LTGWTIENPGWTPLAEKPGYEKWLFGHGCGAWRNLSETCSGEQRRRRVSGGPGEGGTDKVPVFKERESRGGFGEFVTVVVLSSVPIPSQPSSQLR